MRISIVVTGIAVVLITSSMSNCARLGRRHDSSPMEKCLAELRTIPEVDGVLGQNGSGDTTTLDPQPFKGMEIALTLNGALLPTADPDADADDVCYKQNNPENLHKLLAALQQAGMPPTVDFVNGNYFDTGMSEQWLSAGNLLGNLTYDNRKAGQLGDDEFIADVEKADHLLAPLIQRQRRAVKYFRYPAHRVPKGRESLQIIDRYLAAAGFTIVPYTVESKDDRLADIYCRALDDGDNSCARLIKLDYYSVLMDTTIRARAAARELAGREPPHILVLYCNQLTCDTLGETLAWYQRLGAKFISLDKALADPFYGMAGRDGEPMGITVVNTVKSEQRSLRE